MPLSQVTRVPFGGPAPDNQTVLDLTRVTKRPIPPPQIITPPTVQSGPIVPPTLVVYKDAYTLGSTATRVLTQRTVAAGDVVAVIGHGEDFTSTNISSLAQTAGTATIGTITKQQDAGSGTHTANVLFTFTVATAGTLTLTVTFSTTPTNRASTFWTLVATGSNGIGNTAKTLSSTNTITASLTTSDHSAVAAFAADWAATGGSTTTLTPSSPTPVIDARETDGVANQVANGSKFSSRGGHWSDTGTAGTNSYGVTVPTSASGYNLVVVEFLGTVSSETNVSDTETSSGIDTVSALDVVNSASETSSTVDSESLVVSLTASDSATGTDAISAMSISDSETVAGTDNGTVDTGTPQIGIRAALADATTSSTATATFTIPSSAVAGDLAYFIVAQAGAQTITINAQNASGWFNDSTLQAFNGTTWRLSLYRRVLTADDISTTISATFAASQQNAGGLVIISNTAGQDAIAQLVKTTASTTIGFNPVTPTVNNALVLYIAAGRATATSVNAVPNNPTGYTQDAVSSGTTGVQNRRFLEIGHKQLTGGSGVAEDPPDATVSTATNDSVFTISLAPVAGPTTVSDSDSSSTVDSVTSLADTSSETSSTVDSASVVVSLTASDSATGSDAITVRSLSTVDNGTSTETVTVRSLSTVDTSTGTDVVSSFQSGNNFSDTDTSTGTENTTTFTRTGIAETSSATETATVAVSLSVSEIGTGTDIVTVSARANTVTETVAGTEAQTDRTLSTVDSASGIDSATLSASLNVSETSSSNDVITVNAKADVETVTGTEASTNRTLSTVDSATGTDVVSQFQSGNSFFDSDTVTGAENTTTLVRTGIVETATSTDNATVNVSLTVSDSATGNDAVTVSTRSNTVTENVTGNDTAVQVLVPKAASETSSTVDSASLSAQQNPFEVSASVETAISISRTGVGEIASATETATVSVIVSANELVVGTESGSVQDIPLRFWVTLSAEVRASGTREANIATQNGIETTTQRSGTKEAKPSATHFEG